MTEKQESMLEEIRRKIATAHACPCHKFTAPEKLKLGEKLTCQNCNISFSLVDISKYARGYKVAGGNPDDILKDFIK